MLELKNITKVYNVADSKQIALNNINIPMQLPSRVI